MQQPVSSTSHQQNEFEVISTRYHQQVVPFWDKQVIRGTVEGKQQVSIAYAFVEHPDAIGAIVLSTGRIEALIKYKELVYDFYQAGYSVFIHDHRGQGESGRMTSNHHHGYVEDFSDYVEDFEHFYQQIVAPRCSQKPFLVCHSMGSAIGALYILKFPERFQKVVFSAPMFGIRPPMPNWLSTLLVGSHLFLSRLISPAPRYFFGQGDYQNVSFEDNMLTRSQARYEIFRQEYQHNPSVQLGGVTSHWLRAAVNAMNYIEQHAEQLTLPVLHLQAEADKIVENKRQTRVCRRFPHCQSHVLAGSEHEILMEQEQVRDQAMSLILAFLKA